MFNKIVPRICRNAKQAIQVQKRCSSKIPIRYGFWENRPSLFRDRGHPGSSLLDHFGRRPWRSLDRMMEDHFRQMEEMMERFTTPMFRVTDWAKPNEFKVTYNDKNFEVKIEVEDFSPEELEVKVVDNRLLISAQHEQKPDKYGYVKRTFSRELLIPEDVDPESIECELSDNGTLLLIRAKVKPTEPPQERVININKKDPSKEKQGEEESK